VKRIPSTFQACNYRKNKARPGRITFATATDGNHGKGEPGPLNWSILWDYADSFMAIPDFIAAKEVSDEVI